ncbi:hypothetical protein OROGR_012228 [Orobanche gracilis]
MVWNRSVVNSSFNLEILCVFALIFLIKNSQGYTIPSDVVAINSLYVALGSPPLPDWLASGGDPCGDAVEPWQGVACDASSIISITLNGANLGGELGNSLGTFSSIKSITLNNNFIGGSIPSELPPSLVNLFLSDNKLIGSIPSSLSSISQLQALSLNNNELTGEIPDAFEALTALVNLDLSNNSLSGQLPPSIRNLSSLVTLSRLQNNQLSGTLDVLKDLPLRDKYTEQPIFWTNTSKVVEHARIPRPMRGHVGHYFEKVGESARSDGNPFNASTAPLPSPTPPSGTQSPAQQFFPSPTSEKEPPPSGRPPPAREADGPEGSNSERSRRSSRTRRIVWISIAAVLSFIILILAILLFMLRCLRERREAYRTPKRHEIAPYTGTRENPRDSGSLVLRSHDEEKGYFIKAAPVAVLRTKEENQERPVFSVPKQRNEEVKKTSEAPRRNRYDIDKSRFDIDVMPPPPPPPPPPPRSPPRPSPPPPPPLEKVIVSPITASEATGNQLSTPRNPTTSVEAYSVAFLQQCTNSFSQDNLVGGGRIGNVYRAKLPNGGLLAIKKLDKRVANQLKDEQFIELVNNLDKIRHTNVVELMGYCSEHGQRLLVYKYCSNGTLQDALHSDDEFKRKPSLPWNTRIRMALGAARALEYLHEGCEPPIIHRNLKSANVLLDDELAVFVSDCGLAPLFLSGAVNQLSGQLLTAYGYGAPEFESGIYTMKSDVYSFGVVMLELLTGRKSYDKSRTRGEQILVRWAIPQLHDIDALSRMIDPDLGGTYPVKSLSHFADIISRCVLAEPEFRPLMSEVVQDLMLLIRRESSDERLT